MVDIVVFFSEGLSKNDVKGQFLAVGPGHSYRVDSSLLMILSPSIFVKDLMVIYKVVNQDVVAASFL